MSVRNVTILERRPPPEPPPEPEPAWGRWNRPPSKPGKLARARELARAGGSIHHRRVANGMADVCGDPD